MSSRHSGLGGPSSDVVRENICARKGTEGRILPLRCGTPKNITWYYLKTRLEQSMKIIDGF